MTRLFLLTTLFLAACGADGAPEAPAAKPGLTISGDAQIGVVSQ
jgi:hypothetical protein